MRVRARFGALVFLVAWSAYGQSGVGIDIDEVIDNRMAHEMLTGSLELRVKLKGTNLDRASAARVVVKDARDDRGNVLSDPSRTTDFTARDVNGGTMQVSLNTPARAASTVRMKGTVELFVPTRDPNAVVTVDKAFSKLDAPLTAKALKAAKIEITPLSAAGYAASRKANKLDDAKIAEIRAEGKKHGASDKEIDAVIEFAKAMDAMDETPDANTVILSGEKADFDRIFRVEIVGADGKPIDVNSRSTSSRGESAIMTLSPASSLPPNAGLQFYLLTDKSKMSFPFELSVPLP